MSDKELYPLQPVYIIDDELQAVQGMDVLLRSSGILNTRPCQDSRLVRAMIEKAPPEVVLTDLCMPYVGGEEILSLVVSMYPDTPVIVVTATDEIEIAVRCVKAGAFDYLVKPITRERLVSTVRRALELRTLKRECDELRTHVLTDSLTHPEAFSGFAGVSRQMQAVFRYVESIAGSPEPVLITGETGVGKEIVARSIHSVCGFSGEFVPVNVAGLDETAFSDVLFGHKRGAFTGAHETRKGLVEKASGGLLFLDEIGDLDMNMQVKLLRLLQEREFMPMGSDVAVRTTARVVVATNKDLDHLRNPAVFRPDLFYRLRRHHVHIPPLRERMEDVPHIFDRVLKNAATAMKKKVPTLPRGLFENLATYPFPGNVRELEAMIHEALAGHKSGTLSMQVFVKWIADKGGAIPVPAFAAGGEGAESGEGVSFGSSLPTMKQVQSLIMDEALKRAGGNQAIAARMLGITRQALNRRILTGKEKGEEGEEKT